VREKLEYYKQYLFLWYPRKYPRINNRLLRKTVKLFSIPVFLFQNAKLILPNYLALKYLDLPITTRCSLNCAKCSNLMQYYENPAPVNTELFLGSIDTFFRYVDHVVQLNILGGEPFTNTDLAKILNYLIGTDKVKRIVVITNGTILPRDPELMKALAYGSVEVHISDYGALSTKTRELCERFSKENISYEVRKISSWRDLGEFGRRERTEGELKKQFAACNTQCRSYFMGQFHVCPRSAHGMDLGVIPVAKSDYVDLTNENLDASAMKRAIRKLDRSMEYVTACDYCDSGTSASKEIPPAEQMPSGRKSRSPARQCHLPIIGPGGSTATR